MNSPATTLAELLSAELRTLKCVSEALDGEHAALVDGPPDALESAVARKNEALQQHREQLDHRLAWTQAQGLPPDAPLSSLLSSLQASLQDAALAEQQRALADLATQCQEANRRNGLLIARRQQRTRGALDILRGVDSQGDVYSLSGAREHGADSRSLGKA
jgi:flagella synthesis protein FlgN